MITAALRCPASPELVLGELQAAAVDAAQRLVDTGPGIVFVVGAGDRDVAYSAGDWGTVPGLDGPVALGARVCAGQAILPVSVTIGAWLLRQTSWTGDVQGYGLDPAGDPARLPAYAEDIAALDDRVALLVVAGPGEPAAALLPADAVQLGSNEAQRGGNELLT